MSHDQLIGSGEACAILHGIDRSTLTRWVQTGKLAPAQRVGALGVMLFDRNDVTALAAQVAPDIDKHWSRREHTDERAS